MNPSPDKSALDAARAQMKRVYETKAQGWDRRRPRALHERAWLERFRARLPEGGGVLDIGCGAGEPVARYLREAGYSVTGVDYSAPMIELAKARLPDARWIVGDMRALALGETFDGVIGWDSFFHLTMEEQRAALPLLAAHLAAGGALLLTVGPEAGETTGMVEGEAVYHGSLDFEEYREILAREGFRDIVFAAEDPDCDFHSVLLASKRP